MYIPNRLKGFYSRESQSIPNIDLRDYRVPEELWMEVCDTVQEVVTKTIPKKKKCNKAKWLSEEALQIPTHELL